MRKRTKLIIGLSLILVLVISGATMAWFTSNPANILNTFKTSTVNITLNDTQTKIVDGVSTEVNFPENGISNVNPGDYYDKNVSVTSNGLNQTYVRVKITPKWTPAKVTVDNENIILNTGEPVVSLNLYLVDWVKGGTDADGGTWYYYTKILTPENKKTTPLLDGVKFVGKYMGNEYQGAAFTIDVKAEAVQASHYAFRDEWQIDSNAKVPAPGVEEWTAANEEPSAAQ
ncbi:MAG: hypothetical protein LIR50_14010 [Bacillota bacterium]|nr:hypothetical protein [Bacillota bacterium]